MENPRYQLPDGRTLIARILDTAQGGDDLSQLWEITIDGETLIGHPLNSALAELLGWNIAHEDWPEWINEIAARILEDVG